MIKISRVEAYQGMNEIDFSVMDDEAYLVSNSGNRGERVVSSQFFLDHDSSIVLKFYWDDQEVHLVRFHNESELTKLGKKQLAEQKKNEEEKGMKEVETKEAVRNLVSETNSEIFYLSANMIKLEVVRNAVAQLMERIDEITYKKWNEDPAMARLSIDEIKDTVRLIDMAFYPLFKGMSENVSELESTSSELFDIFVTQKEINIQK